MSAQRASQLVEAGLWLRLSGDHEGAKRLFEQALKLDPANARARQLLDSPPQQPTTPGADAAPIAKSTMELDWGMATGVAATPSPPGVPVVPPPVKPPVAGGGTFTVRLGDLPVREVPPAPQLDPPGLDALECEVPHSSSTEVFGGSGVPVPPAATGALPQSSTLVFGLSSQGVAPAVPPVVGTGGFTVPSGGTLVFSGMQPEGPGASPPLSPTSTLVFGGLQAPRPGPSTGPPASGTLVFAQTGAGPEPAAQSPSTGTMVFGSAKAAPPAPESVGPGSTLVFGGVKASGPVAPPPSVPPQSRGDQLATDPGLPPFEPEIEIDMAGAPSDGPLEFNFDDMVTQPEAPSQVPARLPWEDGQNGDAPRTAWDGSQPRIDIKSVEAQGGGGAGFDLISAPPAPQPKPRSPAQLRDEVQTLLSGAKDLLDLDDHTGAMELIGKALELDPADAGAVKLRERSERTLEAMFESKLGDLNQIPRVKLKDDEIIWLNLDHRAGFVLAQIDGSVTFEDLFAVSGMSRLDTARILAQLVEEGVISKA